MMRCLYAQPLCKSGWRRRSFQSGVASKERVSDSQCRKAWPSLGKAIQSARVILNRVGCGWAIKRRIAAGKSGAPHKGSGFAVASGSGNA